MRPRRRSSSPRIRSSAETSARREVVERPHRVQAQQAQADVAEVDAVERPVVKALRPERAPVAHARRRGSASHSDAWSRFSHPARNTSAKLFGRCSPMPNGLQRRPVRGRRPLRRLAQSVALRHGSIFASVSTESPDPKSLARIERDGVEDFVAVEEPLEIRVDGQPLAITMRTPGDDEELALGFLYGEGLIDRPHDAGMTRRPGGQRRRGGRPASSRPGHPQLLHDVVVRRLRQGRDRAGRGALGAPGRRPEVERDLLAVLPDRLRQPGFERTGGLHATGLFDPWGEVVCVREDVGRHNAMDKVIGWALARELCPLRDRVLCVSGRLSFELVQKACVAGAPILVGVGAPSSLAIELAQDRGLTLAGFARNGSVNVYAGRATGAGLAGPRPCAKLRTRWRPRPSTGSATSARPTAASRWRSTARRCCASPATPTTRQSKGYICPKAAALADLYTDPDRLTKPVRREGDGWVEMEWDEALDLAADGLRTVLDRDGDRLPSPPTSATRARTRGRCWRRSRCARRSDAATTIRRRSTDQLPQHRTSAEMFGNLGDVPDPRPRPDGLHARARRQPVRLQRLADDARRARGTGCATSSSAAGPWSSWTRGAPRPPRARREHVAVRPGGDAFLLLGMLHVIFAEGLTDVPAYCVGADEVAAVVADWTPERAARARGRRAGRIETLARDFAGADSAVAYGRVGVCQQRTGTLIHWLINVLNAVTGNLDRRGGAMFPRAVPRPPPGAQARRAAAGPTASGAGRSASAGCPR